MIIALGAFILNGCEKEEMIVIDDEISNDKAECPGRLKVSGLMMGMDWEGGKIFYFLQYGDLGYESSNRISLLLQKMQFHLILLMIIFNGTMELIII